MTLHKNLPPGSRHPLPDAEKDYAMRSTSQSREECEPERDRDREHEGEGEHKPEPKHCDEPQPSKIVERTWYFDHEEECEKPRAHTHGREPEECDADRDRCDDSHPGRPKHPGRPTRPPGVSTGQVSDGRPLSKGDINAPDIPGVWVGTRPEMDLPYLFMRANAGDLGARPIVHAPFWESPDVFVLAGVSPALAPSQPTELGQVAIANRPNTLYVHVWNFGKAAAHEVVVEFYWLNPTLIIAGQIQPIMIAQTFTTLGAKGRHRSHDMVKCPEPWTPTFVNGGHECLLVRVWDNTQDLPGEPKFDASINRHVAQRNIHVKQPKKMMALSLAKGAPAMEQPLLLQVGPLFGSPAQVAVERVAPNAVPWLQLHTGKRGVFPAMAPPTGIPTLSPPMTFGGGFPTSSSAAVQQQVHGDDQHVAFSTSDDAPGPGQAHVYRVSAKQGGATYGGYTVVILG